MEYERIEQTSGRDSESGVFFVWHSDGTPRDPGLAPPPESVGPYRILGHLGTGGMGEVFLAEDERLNRKIALKRIRPDRSGNEQFRRRFEVEARVTARLQHPAIISVYQLQTIGSDVFYTMRPVQGTTLLGLLTHLREDLATLREEWPVARIVRLFLQAANAVAYAHSRGVVHRDLKPANIIIGPFEEVLVLDWGLAKIMDGHHEEAAPPDSLVDLHTLAVETSSESFIGTPGYMAPELFDGHPADPPTDVFSLGVILYELLALRHPWARTHARPAPLALMESPPVPTAVQPGRRIPANLAAVAMKAIAVDRAQRFQTVSAFTREIAGALEGRAPWGLTVSETETPWWRLGDGRRRDEEGVVILRSRGARGFFRYLGTDKLSTNVRVSFDLGLRKGYNELQVWLSARIGGRGAFEDGYALEVVPGRRRTLHLLRSGRGVAGAKSVPCEARRWYHITATREGDRLSLEIDGEEIYAYRDVIPLPAGYVGLTGSTAGMRIRNLRVYERGPDVRISCLSIPDAFFHRGLFEDARAEYDTITSSHPGRVEGQLARFRSGLCLLEMHGREQDPDVGSLLLEEALETFTDKGRIQGACLADLGRAIVSGRRGQPSEKHDALAVALSGHPDDPHLPFVVEWILGRLHAAQDLQRRTIAELLPLAIDHCMEHWGRRVVSDLVRRVRGSWETPPFMTGRKRFRQGDPVSHAESKLFFAFWAGRGALVAATVTDLAARGLLRPHHVADGVFALLALEDTERAGDLLQRAGADLPGEACSQEFARVAVLAARGRLEESESLMNGLELDPTDRVANSARLWLGRALFHRGDDRRGRRVLRPCGPRDFFAREHLAWFLLMTGRVEEAERQLAPLIERRHHLLDRDMVNFLLGVTLIARGRREEADVTFHALPSTPWPRTWCLGSYLAADRLGGGSVEAWSAEAFPWERSVLDDCRTLLERASPRE